MTAPHHRGALEALHAARPSIARLGASQGPEDRAADLIEGWSAVETALRSLVGGSAHSGQALIRELRAKQVITFDQGNALAEFHSASERSRQSSYSPSDADINSARDAFLKLEAGLMAAVAGETAPIGRGYPPGSAPAAARHGAFSDATPIDVPPVVTSPPPGGAAGMFAPPRAPKWVKGLAGAVALLVLVGLGWWAYTTYGSGSELDEAIGYYNRGQLQEAAAAFERVARENPNDARPHIYLARMARQAGNMTLARDEASKAVTADPRNPLAHGEMARYLMAAGNWDLARQFWVRALQIDANDKAAQGYLGCTFARLGRYDEARTWLTRAGQGEWSVCLQQLPPAGAYPPGAQYPQGQVPPGQYPQYPPGQVPPGAYQPPYPQGTVPRSP